MLRFSEVMELQRPVSAAGPPDRQLSPMLKFDGGSMQSDDCFPWSYSYMSNNIGTNGFPMQLYVDSSALLEQLDGHIGGQYFMDSWQYNMTSTHDQKRLSRTFHITPTDGLTTTKNTTQSLYEEHLGYPNAKKMSHRGSDILPHSKRQKISCASHERPCSSAPSPATTKAPPNKKSQRLGDKITALQQLVSPFGKTDTASVLQEASVCIKNLHEQIQVLVSPYFQRRTSYRSGLQAYERERLSLRNRGLCLVPISTVFNSVPCQELGELHDGLR